MNQTEATHEVAKILGWGWEFIGTVYEVKPVYSDSANGVLAKLNDGTTLSVTVEILAQP